MQTQTINQIATNQLTSEQFVHTQYWVLEWHSYEDDGYHDVFVPNEVRYSYALTELSNSQLASLKEKMECQGFFLADVSKRNPEPVDEF